MDAEIARDEISISPYLGDEMQYEMRLRSVLERGGGPAKACGITSEDSASRAPVVRYPPLSLTLRLALSLALTLTLTPSLTLSLAPNPYLKQEDKAAAATAAAAAAAGSAPLRDAPL